MASRLFALLLFLCSASCFAQQPFDGVGDEHYLDWLATAGDKYPLSVYLPSFLPAEGAAIHWNIKDDTFELAVAVKASGWAAFGISENGGMQGADMIIFEALDGGTIIDAHVLDVLLPVVDDCQSWTLTNSVVKDFFLIFEAKRLVDTGDTQDRALLDDSSLLTPANRIIAAWGHDEHFAYHGEFRAKGSVRFYGSDSGDEWENFRELMLQESEGAFELRASNYMIPTRETTYREFCFQESDLIALGMPANTELHSIGIEPILDESSAVYLHHFLVYGNTSPFGCGSLEVTHGWAPGDLPVSLPLNVGGPLGTNGFRAFTIQIHYNNPFRVSGVRDSSGIRVYFTSQKREHDLGVFQLGDPFVQLSGRSVGEGLTSHDFECPAACSQTFLSESLNVIRESLHMHKSGRRMVNSQRRGGEIVRVATADYFDFDQQGSLAVVQDSYTIEPGDSFDTRCYYDSELFERFGLGSQDEMCIAYIYYYPRQTTFGLPLMCGYGLGGVGFPQCAASWTPEPISDVAGLDRNFGAPASVCNAPPSQVTNPIICFPGQSIVHVRDRGLTRMSDLQLGDQVLVDSGNNYEPVYSFGHHNSQAHAPFVEITSNSSTLLISSQHLLFGIAGEHILASQVSVGDELVDARGFAATVTRVRVVRAKGVFAPFTLSGKLIVDDVLVSSYASLLEGSPSLAIADVSISFHWLSHAFQFPHRLLCHYLHQCKTEAYTSDGISTWVEGPKRWATWMLQKQSGLVRSGLFLVLLTVLSLFVLIEFGLLNPVISGILLYATCRVWRRFVVSLTKQTTQNP